MAPDSMLGRTYLYHDGSTIRARVTVVGWCPQRGWRLAGQGYQAGWCSVGEFGCLLRAGVLEVA